MRPFGLGKKPTFYCDPCVPWLMKLSKAALADLVVDLLRLQADRQSADEPVDEQYAIDRATPVILLRCDVIPKSQIKKGHQ